MLIKTKKIIPVICNANQARSVAAASFLQLLHPSLSFKSYGVNAITSTKIPQSTISFLNKWQLPLLNSKSLNIRKDFLQLQKSDIILAADSKVAKILVSLGVSRNVISIVDQSFLPPELIPRDPLGLPEDKFELELAKFVFSASMLFSQATNGKLGFSVYVPWSNLQYKSAQYHLGQYSQSGINLLIDAYAQGVERGSVNLLQWSSAKLGIKPQQVMKQFRKICVDSNSSVYYYSNTAASFRDLIRIRDQISIIQEEKSTRKINPILITQPLFEGNGMQAKTLLNASVSNGYVKFFMPNSQLGQKLLISKPGAPCHS